MDPDGLLSRIAPYAACCIVSALVFLILGWAAAKKGARLPGWLSALANRLGGLGNQETVTEEQLLDLVDDAGEQEVIDDDQAEMINSVVELADVTAGHIMTHRTDMTALEENMPAWVPKTFTACCWTKTWKSAWPPSTECSPSLSRPVFCCATILKPARRCTN